MTYREECRVCGGVQSSTRSTVLYLGFGDNVITVTARMRAANRISQAENLVPPTIVLHCVFIDTHPCSDILYLCWKARVDEDLKFEIHMNYFIS